MMPLEANEVFVPFCVVEGIDRSDDQARCLGCDAVLQWDMDVADYWVNHTVLECIQKIRLDMLTVD